MVDLEKLSKSWGLDFWAKAIGIFMPISILTGYAFLNGYYAVWWGFTDYSISKEVCVVVMIWFALIAYLADRFGRMFNSAVEKLERWKHGKRIVLAFLFLSILLETISRLSYTQQLARKHQIYLPPGRSLAIFVCILYVAFFFVLAAPLSWLREFREEKTLLEVLAISPKAANRSSGLHLLQVAVGMLVIFVTFWVFAGTYELIPARYGGGKPDPIQFWVPRSAQAVFLDFLVRLLLISKALGKLDLKCLKRSTFIIQASTLFMRVRII